MATPGAPQAPERRAWRPSAQAVTDRGSAITNRRPSETDQHDQPEQAQHERPDGVAGAGCAGGGRRVHGQPAKRLPEVLG